MKRLTCTTALTLLRQHRRSQITSLPQLPVTPKVDIMLCCSYSFTSVLMLLGLLLPQISAGLGGMSLPDGDIPGAQALETRVQSSVEHPLDPGLTVESNPQTGSQLEPQQGIKSAKCEVFPLTGHYTVIADFQNWDPDQDGKAALFEEILAVKFGRDNISGFWWKKFPPDTRFKFHIPYLVGDNQENYTVISDAIFEYSGDAKIRTTVYHF